MLLFAVVGYLLPGVAAADNSTDPPPLIWPLYSPTDADVDAWEAWDASMGDDVTVGVIDQSVFAGHFKFAGRIDSEVDVVSPAVDAQCSVAAPTLANDHGTQVAGLIVGQHGGAGLDPKSATYKFAGLAPNARVRPIRAVNNCGDANIDDIVAGIKYAEDADLPIAVLSLATSPLLAKASKDDISAKLDAAFAYASSTLFVVAAGNTGNDNDVPGKEVYPCSSTAANVLCVGMTGEATDRSAAPYTDAPVCWGNVGEESVDLFAPGLGIYSTVRSNAGSSAFWPGQGTSMAAPLVAAAAALVEALDPRTTGPIELRDALTGGVDAHFELQPFAASGGRLNAARTLLGDARGLGAGGSTKPWVSCDRDHDTVRDTLDNCPDVPNPDQADDDEDGIGNACDQFFRGPDADGDGKGAMDDACPTQYALTANGCPPPPPPPPPPPTPTVTPTPIPTTQPTPTPTATPTPISGPQIKVLQVGVTKGKAAKVTIRLSRTAKVSLKIERKSGRKWKRITTKSMTASISSKSLTLRPKGKKKLVKGSYRLTATVVGGRPVIRVFKVK